jgi:hypothetical protein
MTSIFTFNKKRLFLKPFRTSLKLNPFRKRAVFFSPKRSIILALGGVMMVSFLEASAPFVPIVAQVGGGVRDVDQGTVIPPASTIEVQNGLTNGNTQGAAGETSSISGRGGKYANHVRDSGISTEDVYDRLEKNRTSLWPCKSSIGDIDAGDLEAYRNYQVRLQAATLPNTCAIKTVSYTGLIGALLGGAGTVVTAIAAALPNENSDKTTVTIIGASLAGAGTVLGILETRLNAILTAKNKNLVKETGRLHEETSRLHEETGRLQNHILESGRLRFEGDHVRPRSDVRNSYELAPPISSAATATQAGLHGNPYT